MNMEKKTIGAFIAALRRANGMTQRDLAERLNVSDKTVSRWERDDGTPDLSLIPVIAELFDVTCDELLRGERKPAEERSAPTEDTPISAKGEKAVKHLLAESLRRFRAQSLISVGVDFAGLIAAMIANLGFLRGYIGFFLGVAFCAASAICQWIFTDRAWLAAADDSIDTDSTNAYRWKVLRIALAAFGATFVMLCVMLPLLLSGDAYYGLAAGSWLGLGLVCLVVAAAVWYGVCCAVRGSMLKRGKLTLAEDTMSVLSHNMRLQRRIALTTAIILAATLLAHVFVSEVFGAWQIAEGTEFNDYESFAEFMAQRNPGPWPWSTATEYMDAYGNIIPQEEAVVQQLTLADGTVVCEFQHYNGEVAWIGYSEQDGSLLPIEVVTYGQVEQARVWVVLRNVVFCMVYAAEVIVAFVVYFRRRAR